jgi:glucose-1-phosphate cytidylyltransferase
MKVVILAGGTGTRLREMTEFQPKALVQVGGRPLVWHIMKIYATHGITEFVLALGYKQESFKAYFALFDEINTDILINRGMWGDRQVTMLGLTEGWSVILSDTGVDTQKGARLKRVEKYVQDDTFMCTYVDGVADVDISALLDFHRAHGKIATITGVHPAPRFGEIYHEEGLAKSFREKPDGECLTNGGFMVFNKEIFERLSTHEKCDLETEVFGQLVKEKQLMVYHHKGYFGCMDTMKDVGVLQNLWDSGSPPWRVWE